MEKQDLEEIKSRTDIVTLISAYTPLTKSGRNYKGLCPFHNEKTPSFMVSPDLQIFKCFGCQKGGDVFNFIQEAEGIEFVDAAVYLAEKAGVKIELKKGSPQNKDRKDLIKEINHRASEFYHFILTKHPLGKDALEYIKVKRGLSDEMLKAFNIGYAPNSWRSLSDYLQKKNYRIDDVVASGLSITKDGGGVYDRFRGRITFPINDVTGSTIGFSARALGDESPKYLNTPETEVFHKGKVLYGIEKAKVFIKRMGLAVLVEGQMDVVSAHMAGFGNVVASGGTALTLDHLEILKKLTKDIAFCFDTDFAGFEATSRAIELAESVGLNVKVVVIPKPFKDLDECVRADKEVFAQALEQAGSIYDFYLLSAFTRNNVFDPLGKKKIVDFLAPLLAKIKNPVLKEHYIKKVAVELNTSESSIYGLVEAFSAKNQNSTSYRNDAVNAFVGSSLQGTALQEHILSLILKTPLDLAQTSLYKLGQRDFTDRSLEGIFIELKEHLLGRKRKFDVKTFCAKLDTALSQRVESLYLRDTPFSDDESETQKLRQEILVSLKRLKAETVKRELKLISNKIKEAESSSNFEEVERLTEEFKNVSERLI